MQDVKTSTNLPYVIFLGVTAALGGMMFGFDLGIIVGAGPFLIQHFGLSDLGLGWAYSSLLFGCVLGSVIAGRLTDQYGRQKMLLLVALLFIITSIATGLAPNFALFVAARFAGGVAVGGVSVLSPMYIAEVSPPNIRGRMGATYQLSITLGILVSYCINYGLRNLGDWNWRWMFISGALPSVLFFVTLLRAPETPRFLFKIGRKKEGMALLARIMDAKEAAIEAAEIEASLAGLPAAAEPLTSGPIRRVVLISFVLAVLIQTSGINTIIDYAPLMLKSAGWKIDAALFSTFFIGGINFAFTLVSYWTIDRYGRKPLYIVGSLGMTAALALIIGMLAMGRFDGGVVVALMAVFIAFFASCIGPVFWTLVPEIFPNRVRGRAMVVPVVAQWVTNAFVILLFPLAFNQAGKIPTFTFLAGMALLQAIFTWRFLPETKGKTLEEIEDYWSGKRTISQLRG
ncbi:MAG TPA: sugar porter family MFS transporter [Silvibacterium sp.]|nr:sugar porter family MFS transporter [Silvibacterium sp.]